MPRTAQEQAAWEEQCYGIPAAEFLASVESSLTVRILNESKVVDDGEAAARAYGMVAMSMLSDAQEEVSRGMREEARQTINRAKLVLTTYWMKRA